MPADGRSTRSAPCLRTRPAERCIRITPPYAAAGRLAGINNFLFTGTAGIRRPYGPALASGRSCWQGISRRRTVLCCWRGGGGCAVSCVGGGGRRTRRGEARQPGGGKEMASEAEHRVWQRAARDLVGSTSTLIGSSLPILHSNSSYVFITLNLLLFRLAFVQRPAKLLSLYFKLSLVLDVNKMVGIALKKMVGISPGGSRTNV